LVLRTVCFLQTELFKKTLWKERKKDVYLWQWQQPSKKLLTLQNRKRTSSEGDGEARGNCEDSTKDEGFVRVFKIVRGDNASSSDKNIKNLMHVTGDAKEFLEEGLCQTVISL